MCYVPCITLSLLSLPTEGIMYADEVRGNYLSIGENTIKRLSLMETEQTSLGFPKITHK